MHCLVCQAPAGRYFIQLPGAEYSVYKCAQCGLEHTAPVPSEAVLSAFYAAYHDVRADRRVVQKNASANLDFLHLLGISPTDQILDYGCGHGDFVDMAGPRCWGLELHAAEHPRIAGTAAGLPLGQRFRAITLWGVLEHLRDPVATLAEVDSLLEDGGWVVMTTVNAEGMIPYYYKPPEHLTYWTQAAVEACICNTSLRLQQYSAYTMTQLGSVYANRLLSRTPEAYQAVLANALPEFVQVPTNECLIVLQKGAKAEVQKHE